MNLKEQDAQTLQAWFVRNHELRAIDGLKSKGKRRKRLDALDAKLRKLFPLAFIQ